MNAFALVLVFALVWGCADWASTGSVYRSRCLHVGVRPASDAIDEWAVTVQISNEWGPCPRDGGKP